MSITPDAVLTALTRIVEPKSGKDIVRLNLVRDLVVEGSDVGFTIMVKDPTSEFAKGLEDIAVQVVHQQVSPDAKVRVEVDSAMIGIGDVQQQNPRQSQIETGATNLIAVASGKGGVGKSTVAVNLAIALAKQGYEVGLVDVDIYGPSIPTMFGLEDQKPRVNEQRKIVPLERHGVRVLSMGFLVDQDKAVIWRGPMVSNAVRQFLGDAEWGELDYLILDLPPGTGDIQLTLVQSVALTGAVIVSTPQKVALADARKGVAMFENVNVPVLGIIENMAYFTPPELPDKKYFLFGEGGARRLAESLKVPVLGEVPIEEAVRRGGDEGEPVVVSNPSGAASVAFDEAARRLAASVALRNAQKPAGQAIEILYR
jgi:ATP-binding protein involved in chromosome partitioning